MFPGRAKRSTCIAQDKEAARRGGHELLKGSDTLFVSDYRGLTVAEITQLRGQLRERGARVKVLKNTLTRRAAGPRPRRDRPAAQRPVGHHVLRRRSGGPAKALTDFARTHDRAGGPRRLPAGHRLDADGVKALAALPPREVLLAQVVGTLAAPVTGLVTVLNGTLAGCRAGAPAGRRPEGGRWRGPEAAVRRLRASTATCRSDTSFPTFNGEVN